MLRHFMQPSFAQEKKNKQQKMDTRKVKILLEVLSEVSAKFNGAKNLQRKGQKRFGLERK